MSIGRGSSLISSFPDNMDADHRDHYGHSDDTDHNAIPENDHGQFGNEKCWYGTACHNMEFNHRSQFAHPNDSTKSHCPKPKCHFWLQCTKTHN
ncbi:unnamed protein product [Rotaria sordida]|uniref:Uncharacterized protein n=1 Tax=Rotaria sordida TaxID=392033 RepID=A0A814SIV8_9BILA|nr:unnamed protein product [Rotaria sordida]CAF1381936.1 unnamed protein product [Rotaria sordida]